MSPHRIVLAALCVMAVAVSAQEGRKAGENPKAVLPERRRAIVLTDAEEFLTIRPASVAAEAEDLLDPFYPTVKRVRKTETVEPVRNLDTNYLLTRAAESIKPQGTMLIGSEPYLLLDGKRFKAGDIIPVNVDGVGVQITVTSIQRNSYTLRLEDQELRRDFK